MDICLSFKKQEVLCVSFFKYFVEKIAASADVEKDKELIRLVQQTGDPLAWQQLKIRFKGLINKAVQTVKGTASGMDDNTLTAAAMKQFEKSVLNYSESSGIQPNTYIFSSIKSNMLTHRNERAFETRRGGISNVDIARYMHNSRTLFERQNDREPNYHELQSTITDLYGKKYSIRDLERVDSFKRNELSANKMLGSEGEGENISFGEIYNVGDVSGSDFLKAQRQKEKTDKALAQLSPFEQKLLSEHMGIGDFANRKPASFAALAFNNNLDSAWQAQKMIKDIKTKLDKELG